MALIALTVGIATLVVALVAMWVSIVTLQTMKEQHKIDGYEQYIRDVLGGFSHIERDLDLKAFEGEHPLLKLAKRYGDDYVKVANSINIRLQFGYADAFTTFLQNWELFKDPFEERYGFEVLEEMISRMKEIEEFKHVYDVRNSLEKSKDKLHREVRNLYLKNQ